MQEGTPETQSVVFAPVAEESAPGTVGSVSWELLSRLELPVQVELGRVELSMVELLDITPGSVLELDKAVGEPVEVYVAGKLIARGEVVVVLGDRLGVRVMELVKPS